MSQRFQIVAMPRSGTAFLATLFNMADSTICFHEVVADGPDWKAQIDDACQRYRFVGDAGTYGFLPGAIEERARKVWIDRPIEASRQAFVRALGFEPPEAEYLKLWHSAQAWVDQQQPLVIPYAQVFKAETLEMIWNHCVPGLRFPGRKAELLTRFNVQRQDKERFQPKNIDAETWRNLCLLQVAQ
jgi:hypothetical protein